VEEALYSKIQKEEYLMKKLLKKSCVILMAIILATGMLSIPVKAAESASVSISSASVIVGNSVSVTVNVSSSSQIVMCDLWVTYDSNILEAVSGYSNGGSGNVRILSTDSTSFTLTFKALASGSSNIAISSSSIITSMTEDRLTISPNTGRVTVNAPAVDTPDTPVNTPVTTPGGATYSSNNNLTSLQISPGTLSPAFSPNVTSYTTTVGADCAALIVSAPTEDSTAKVSVTGKTMDMGTNTTRIVVTAQNGATKTYVITTMKVAGATPTPVVDNSVVATQAQTTQTETETATAVAAITTTINGVTYNVISDFTNHALPLGYTATSFDFNGQSVTVGKGTNNLTIMYLEQADGSGIGNFYVYDTAAKTFSLLSTVTQPLLTYTILPITSSMEIPDNYTKSTLTINGNDVDVLIPNGSDVKYCIFYGVDSAGKAGWYRFDYTEQTVQKYYGDDLSSVVAASSNVDAQSGNVNLWKIIAAVTGVAAILFLAIMIILAFKLKSKNSDDEYEDDDEDSEDIFKTITYNELHNNDDDVDSIKDSSSDENLDVQNADAESENKEDQNFEIASEIGADAEAEAAATMDIDSEDDNLNTEETFEKDDNFNTEEPFEKDDFGLDTEEVVDDNDQNNDISDLKDILNDDEEDTEINDDDDDDFEFLDIEDLEDK